MVSADRNTAFKKAEHEISEFLKTKGIKDVEIMLSEEEPQAHRVSGKFSHVYSEIDR